MVIPELPINEVAVDLEDGGRWTSLSLAGREWLWSGPGLHTGPRDGIKSYVDVGGLDECFPTVRGVPDHGGLWNQEWSPLEDDEDWDAVQFGEAVLLRRFNGGEIPADAETHSVLGRLPPDRSPGLPIHLGRSCAAGLHCRGLHRCSG